MESNLYLEIYLKENLRKVGFSFLEPEDRRAYWKNLELEAEC